VSILKAIVKSPRVRAEAFDLCKIIAGVIAARYGIKLV
jgi:hypothetical protein